MKTGAILLCIACGLLIVMLCVVGFWYIDSQQVIQSLKTEVTNLKAQVAQLNDDNSRLTADNVKYMKQANLKSFTTEKELLRFLKADTTDQEYKDAYASEACINLMKNAREQGYWMGMGILNQTQENLFSAMLNDRKNGHMSWTTYSIAVVGDGELYYIDPQNDDYVWGIMTMNADFQEYSGREVNFK